MVPRGAAHRATDKMLPGHRSPNNCDTPVTSFRYVWITKLA